MHIAIVDDDPDIAALMMLWLEEEGHKCTHYSGRWSEFYQSYLLIVYWVDCWRYYRQPRKKH